MTFTGGGPARSRAEPSPKAAPLPITTIRDVFPSLAIAPTGTVSSVSLYFRIRAFVDTQLRSVGYVMLRVH